MSEPTRHSHDPSKDPSQDPSPTRKPYQKPAFVREQLFETMALACGKTSSTIAQCRLVRKNS